MNHVLVQDGQWCHLVNNIEQSVLGSNTGCHFRYCSNLLCFLLLLGCITAISSKAAYCYKVALIIWSVCLLVVTTNHAKITAVIEMLFEVVIGMFPMNNVLYGVQVLPREGPFVSISPTEKHF